MEAVGEKVNTRAAQPETQKDGGLIYHSHSESCAMDDPTRALEINGSVS